MTIETVFLGLLFGGSVFFLLAPFFSKVLDVVPTVNYQRNSLMLKKDMLLADLKDLELDRALKKIDKEDYGEIYQQTFDDGINVLKQMEAGNLINDWKNAVEVDLVRLKEREI